MQLGIAHKLYFVSYTAQSPVNLRKKIGKLGQGLIFNQALLKATQSVEARR